MNKKLIAMAVASVFAAPLSVQAVDFSASGFADVTLNIADDSCDNPNGNGGITFASGGVGAATACTSTATDVDGGAANSTEGKFNAAGEVDFMATEGDLTVRMDVDLFLDASAADSASLEQGFFSWNIYDGLALKGGLFNNPVGLEANDAPDIWSVSQGQIFNILDSQTSLHAGNNLTGAAVVFGAGPANIQVGLLNEISGDAEANSLLFTVDGEVMDGLALELGVLTQEDNTVANAGSMENLIDLNAVWKMAGWTVAGEILTAGKVVDNALMLLGNYDFGNGWGVTGRYDMVSFENSANDDDTTMTLVGIWKPTDNLTTNLEYRKLENGESGVAEVSEDSIVLEFIATVGS
ncbi:MAG: hypothetical protein FD165_1054 [Gammaproteobacteria bacterium]|nr:MAG: hypothetical protein FD165_1054 [Gammaproteobacteria bacterium]TND06238.1 MAG: hypothetical protein FD120_725 [Gammaproteobacteria bacterium]